MTPFDTDLKRRKNSDPLFLDVAQKGEFFLRGNPGAPSGQPRFLAGRD
jgi:hypothetical protein